MSIGSDYAWVQASNTKGIDRLVLLAITVGMARSEAAIREFANTSPAQTARALARLNELGLVKEVDGRIYLSVTSEYTN